MSKPEEMTLETAKELTAMAKEGTCAFTVPVLIANCNWLIERVEELERLLAESQKNYRDVNEARIRCANKLQSARELAETIVRYDDQCEPGATYHISEAVDWDGVVAAAREFLKLLEGK